MRPLLPLLSIFACLAVPSWAEPTPEAFQAARDLGVTMGLDKAQMGPTDQMVETVIRRLRLDEAASKDLRAIYEEWFTKDLDQEKMREFTIRLYAEAFTVQELKDIDAFYKTPAGRKMLEVTPELTRKSTQLGAEEARAKYALLQQRLQPFMEKYQPAGGAGAPAK